MAPPPASFILLLKAPLSTPEMIQGILQSPSPPEILEGEREEDDESDDESGEDGEEDDESNDGHITEEDANEDMTDEDDIKPSKDTNVRFCRLTPSERDQILTWLQHNHPSHRPMIIRLAASSPAQRLTRATDLSRRGLDPTMPQHMPSSATSERSNPRYPGPVIEPTYYFFYGTLAEPAVLRSVLGLPDTYQPSYRNAKVLGWRLKEISGGYLALVKEGGVGVEFVVEGKAWECEDEGMARNLAVYETGAYEEVGVEVEVEGVGWLWARTFVGVPGGR